MTETWSTAQAALIVEKPLEAFQKVLERAPVRPKVSRRGGRKTRVFEFEDLVFFRALDDLKRDLTPEMQAELYAALPKVLHGDSAGRVEAGRLTYDFDPYLGLVRSKIEAVQKLLALIDTSGHEPLIKGTTIEAHRIAALCNGMTTEAIQRDYPSLNRQQIRAAKIFAQSHPKPGRPYPSTTAKKTMRDVRAHDADEFLPAR